MLNANGNTLVTMFDSAEVPLSLEVLVVEAGRLLVGGVVEGAALLDLGAPPVSPPSSSPPPQAAATIARPTSSAASLTVRKRCT